MCRATGDHNYPKHKCYYIVIGVQHDNSEIVLAHKGCMNDAKALAQLKMTDFKHMYIKHKTIDSIWVIK